MNVRECLCVIGFHSICTLLQLLFFDHDDAILFYCGFVRVLFDLFALACTYVRSCSCHVSLTPQSIL